MLLRDALPTGVFENEADIEVPKLSKNYLFDFI